MDQLSLFDQVKLGDEKKIAPKVDETALSKLYYSITEVANMFDVNASLLRFWEKEFPRELGKLRKNKKGDRHYTKENIKDLNAIYYLLKEKKMTIKGAQSVLQENKKANNQEVDIVENLQKIRGFLLALKSELKQKKNNS